MYSDWRRLANSFELQSGRLLVKYIAPKLKYLVELHLKWISVLV